MGLLTDRISNKLDRSNLTNEHALNSEPVPLTTRTLALPRFSDLLAWAENLAKYALVSSFLRNNTHWDGRPKGLARLRAMSITFCLFVLLLFLFLVVTLF